MDRSAIERIVEGIDAALGPNADIEAVEELALEILIDDTPSVSVATLPNFSAGALAPESITLHVNLSDCASRLSRTVLAHAYDKVRRLTSGKADHIRECFRSRDLKIPEIRLHVYGAAELIRSFSPADVIEVVTQIEQAGFDASFDSMLLLTVSSGKNGPMPSLLPILEDLLSATQSGEIELELGSNRTGIRAQELLDLATIATGTRKKNPAILSFNTRSENAMFSNVRGDLGISFAVSVWPRMLAAQDRLPIGACYTDRYRMLGEVGVDCVAEANSMLESFVSTVFDRSLADLKNNIQLSIDSPGEGGSPAGIWTGFPIGADIKRGAGKASAYLLTEGLVSALGPREQTEVIANGLPLSDCLTNLRLLSEKTTATDLAGNLVTEFLDSVVAKRTKMIRLTRDPSEIPFPDPAANQLNDQSAWQAEHFIRGGALAPPND